MQGVPQQLQNVENYEEFNVGDVAVDYKESKSVGDAEDYGKSENQEDSNKQIEGTRSNKVFGAEELNSARQRPTSSTRRPSCVRDEFATHNNPGKRNQFHRHKKKLEQRSATVLVGETRKM